MEQYTKWTNLRIYTDPEVTPITGTRIADIPVKEVRTPEGEMISYRDNAFMILKNVLVFPDGSTAHVVEMEDRRWSIRRIGEDKQCVYIENDDGSWARHDLDNESDPGRVVEDYMPDEYHRHFIYLDDGKQPAGNYDSMNKKYTFSVSDFTTNKTRELTQVLKDINVNEDYESIYITGEKQSVIDAMDSLIESIAKARQAILDTPAA